MPEEQREAREGYVAVGRVVRPWGLRGDVKVESLTDFPERFEPGAPLWVGGVERTVERSRSQKGDLYVKLSGVDGPEAAEALRGRLLEVPESELRELPEGDYYHHDLRGLSVRTGAGDELGTVTDILEGGGNAVLVVRGGRGEVLLPFIEDVIRHVDLSGRRIEVELMEGLLPEEHTRTARPPRRRYGRPRPAPPAPEQPPAG